jgi:hypothetical protein
MLFTKKEIKEKIMQEVFYGWFVKLMQAFIKTATTIHKKIQDGVFDVSNEVRFWYYQISCSIPVFCSVIGEV